MTSKNSKTVKNTANTSKTVANTSKTAKAVDTAKAESLDDIINNIDNEVKKLATFILSDIKSLLPQKTINKEKVIATYKETIAKAKEVLIASDADNASDIYTETVTKAKLDRDNALNCGNLWQAVASEYEIDKDFLLKCGFKELSDKENSNKFNCLITSLFNIVKYAHSTKNKLEDCKKTYESIGQDKLCRVFKHGVYGAKKTFNAVKGKEGLNSKIDFIDTLYTLLTK